MPQRTPRQAFRTAMGRDPGRVHPFTHPISKPGKPLPPEAMFHFWHPERDGSEPCPPDFDRQLKLIHPDLHVCRPPARAPRPADSRWIIWNRKPENRYWLCPGWQLLFLWPPTEYAPIPLDNRVFANLALIDARRYSSGTAYFDTIVNDIMRTKGRQAAADEQYRHDRADDYEQATKISNIGHGSKFALHHDGTILPSRGHQNWERERGHFLPSDVVRRDEAEIKRAKGRAFVTVDKERARVLADEAALARVRTKFEVRELLPVPAKQERR